MPNDETERLTEMLTVVVTPAMRARVQEAAEKRGHIPYAYPVRWALQEWLDANEQKTEDEIHDLALAWLANKSANNHKDGHA